MAGVVGNAEIGSLYSTGHHVFRFTHVVVFVVLLSESTSHYIIGEKRGRKPVQFSNTTPNFAVRAVMFPFYTTREDPATNCSQTGCHLTNRIQRRRLVYTKEGNGVVGAGKQAETIP